MITVRYFAAASEAAGTETTEVDARGLDVEALVAQLGESNERLARVLRVSSLLADGTKVTDRSMPLDGVAAVDVLPPFAGG